MFRSPLGRNLAIRARRARRFALVISLFLVAASLPFITHGAGSAQQQEEAQPRNSQPSVKGQANIVEGAEFVPGEVLVRFRTDAAAKTAEAAPVSLRRGGGDVVTFERFEGSDIVRGLRIAIVDPALTLVAVRELANRPDVLYAEPNYIWRATATPNDPRFTSGEMYGLSRINAPAAWDVTQGSDDVVVGVLDGGVDINHEDLKDNIWRNTGEVPANGLDDDGNGYVDDVNGWDFAACNPSTPFTTICGNSSVFDNEDGDDHATHVAGTIGARGNNSVGVVGVNWRVKIMSVKVLGPDGGSTKNIIRGYNYALLMRQRGVNLRVLNNSYGGSGKALAAFDAIQSLSNAGILFVVAAGNGGGDGVGDDTFTLPHYPANYDLPNVIAVASTNSSDTRSGFSNFSSRLVSIGAPGSSILSTTPNNTYTPFSGTSMAAPHVAGAAALVLAAKPDISMSQLRGVIAFTGDRIGALNGITTTGRRLNVANAVQSALENDTTAPGAAGDLYVYLQNARNVTLAWFAPGDDGGAGTAADYDLFFVNPTTGAKVALPTTLVPAPAGTQQFASVNVPFRNFSGTIQLRAYDNAGNSSTTSVAISIPPNSASDPYSVALSAAQPLTSGGTNLFSSFNGNIDDKYTNYTLPAGFNFPFYGVNRTQMRVSTNGTLYFSTPQTREGGDADDAGSSIDDMQGQTMIAGLWDDIDLTQSRRADSGVYVSQPDANRLVLRWQGVTYNFGTPINFEIELRTDGTIQMRYGTNTGIFPVVGISGGEPDAYVVASHTSETQQISLTNAQTVTFSMRPPTISGRVLVHGTTGLAGVTVTLFGSQPAQTQTVVTDASGNYSFNVALGGSYSVTMSRVNYTFSPPTQNFTSLSTSQTFNFTAFRNPYTISGNVMNAGVGVPGVLITLSGSRSDTRTTDANGNYSFVSLPAEGNYTVTPSKPGMAFAPPSRTYTNLSANETGANFTVVPPEPNVLQFSAPTYQFGEGTGHATITVTRTGNTSGAITVNFQTVDDPASVPCATYNGTAYARCDYATTIDTLTFSAADTLKTITIPLIDDVHVEGPETLQIRLLNPTNAQLGAQATATLTITDNGDAAALPNPVFTTPFFVRQQYLDFLSREPESGEPWSAVLNNCPNVNNNPDCDRLTVSKSFFRSPEFQLKGFFVYRFYGLSFGRLPLYTEIVADMRSVTGATEDEVYQKKGAFSNDWVQRPAFKAAFDGKTSSEFVNAMMNSYALQTITTPNPQNPDRGAKVNLTRANLLDGLNNGTLSRAQIVRAIADSDQVFAIEYNRAYVAMQYFGYLRRDPDAGGFNAWLNYLSANPTDDRTMVRGFANSQEYQLRFGPAQ